jgi:hypothetical protein
MAETDITAALDTISPLPVFEQGVIYWTPGSAASKRNLTAFWAGPDRSSSSARIAKND